MRKNKPYINRVTVNIPSNNERKDEFDKWGTYSERIALFVSAALAIVTLSLFFLNLESINLNIQSTTAAIRAADAADSTYNLAKQEFQAQNQAYLQLSKPKIEISNPDNTPTISFNIDNLKSEPAKILSSSVFIFEDTPKMKSLGWGEYNSIERKYESITENDPSINIYVIKETPAPLSYSVYKKIDEPTYRLLRNGKLNAYFFGQIIYYNLVTNTLSFYKFGIEFLGYDPTTGYRFLYSDNSPYEIKGK